RGGVDVESVLPKVRPIVEAVAERGAEAALEYGRSFDGVRPAAVRVPAEALRTALVELDRDVRTALEVAIERARAVHADQRRTDTTTTLGPGATVTERWVPVERVGRYVPGGDGGPTLGPGGRVTGRGGAAGRVGVYGPGGTAVCRPGAVMTVVAGQIAGVGSVVVARPPQAARGGLPRRAILAAAALLGVGEVW